MHLLFVAFDGNAKGYIVEEELACLFKTSHRLLIGEENFQGR